MKISAPSTFLDPLTSYPSKKQVSGTVKVSATLSDDPVAESWACTPIKASVEKVNSFCISIEI